MKKKVVIPYKPRGAQLAIHNDATRFKVLVCHRRFGKTVLTINELIKRALECRLESPRYAYVAPYYNQAKSIAWDYLKKYAGVVPGIKFNESELRADFPNGARIKLYGADSADALRGIYLDGVVLDEVAQMSSRVWSEILRPALSDRLGWAMFIGTPQGKNLFYELYIHGKDSVNDSWNSFLFKASDTGYVHQDELRDARLIMTPDEYEQEYQCSFVASIRGSYYGKILNDLEKDGRICSVPYDPKALVSTYWDIGISDSTAIWFAQTVGRELRIIDFYEKNGEGLQHYIKMLKEKPYIYEDEHYLPHDGDNMQFSTGKSIKDQGYDLGVKFRIVPKLAIQDGINAARTLLPKCVFDERKTAQGLEALRHYRADYDDKRKDFRDRPCHDWASHAADAFRYLAVSYREPSRTGNFKQPDVSWIV